MQRIKQIEQGARRPRRGHVIARRAKLDEAIPCEFIMRLLRRLANARLLAMTASNLLLLMLTTYHLSLTTFAQEPLQLKTETEDIALTDDLNIARAQVAKYPENPEARFNLAIALSKTSLVEEAIKELRKTKILIRKEENKGTIEKKINEYKEIIKQNPEANNIRYRLAFAYYLKAYLIAKEIEKTKKTEQKEKKDISEINVFSSQLIKYSDKNPEIKENLNTSISYFKEFLQYNPTDIWGKVYYAFILAEQFNEITKAKGLWQEALNNSPNNPAPHFFLGELHIKEGNLKEGIKEISQAILLRAQGN